MNTLQEDRKLSRQESIAFLASLIETQLGGGRGTAVFKLACNWSLLSDAERGRAANEWRIEEMMALEAARQIRAIPPGIFRVAPLDNDELLIVAQGLVDGAAVLGAAARLVHCYDDVLRGADAPWCPEVAIGIALSPQSGGTAESLLAAAENALRESMHPVCTGATPRPVRLPARPVDLGDYCAHS